MWFLGFMRSLYSSYLPILGLVLVKDKLDQSYPTSSISLKVLNDSNLAEDISDAVPCWRRNAMIG